MIGNKTSDKKDGSRKQKLDEHNTLDMNWMLSFYALELWHFYL